MCISHVNTIFSTAVQSHHNCNHQAKQKCKKKRKGTEITILFKIPHDMHQKKQTCKRTQTGEEIKIN